MSVVFKRPDDDQLAANLGRAKKYWDSLLALVRSEHPSARIEWKRYTTGWRLVVKGRGRNLAYLNPGQNRLMVSYAFNDKDLEGLARSGLPAKIVKSIRESKQYPEGRAVRIDVKSARDASRAAALLAIKLAF